MKICWDFLEGLEYDAKKGLFKKGYTTSYGQRYNWFEEIESCKVCGDSFLGVSGRNQEICSTKCKQNSEFNNQLGRKHSEETKKRMSERMKGKSYLSEETKKRMSERRKGAGTPQYKGRNIGGFPGYDVFAPLLFFTEAVRRNGELLEVRCTYCGKWFTPTINEAESRIAGLVNDVCKFYCSKGCKTACPIYRKVKYPRGYAPATSREVGSELRKLVLERDSYTCVKCGDNSVLHCHHIDPVINNPIESADVDNCITLCIECHKKAHKISGCENNELKCNSKG